MYFEKIKYLKNNAITKKKGQVGNALLYSGY